MTIQIDSREHAKAIQAIEKYFDDTGVDHFISKLYCGDYMNYDNPRIVVDRKQNLGELCSNVCQQHERFRREMIRALEHGITIVFLCEHGHGIETLADVIWWENPRGKKRVKENGQWVEKTVKVMHGDVLFKILSTMEKRYGVKFLFCDKKDTGRRIVEILGGEDEGGRCQTATQH